MKLNNKRTILVGLAFLSICAFWQMYDSIVPLILTKTFHMNETFSGAIMAADNILALFLLPFFGSVSDKSHSKLGKRMPFILFGTGCAIILMNILPLLDNSYAAQPSGFKTASFVIVLGLLLVAMGTYRAPAVALMPDVTPKPLRSRANAIINLMGAVGGIIALGLMSVLVKESVSSYIYSFIAAAVIMMLALVLFIVFVREKKLVERREEDEIKLGLEDDNRGEMNTVGRKLTKAERKSMIFLLLSVVFWFMGYNAVTSSFSVYAEVVWKIEGGGFSIPMMVASAAAIIAYVPVGILANKIGRKKTIYVGLGFMLIAFLGATGFGTTFFGFHMDFSGGNYFANGDFYILCFFFALCGIGWATISVNSYPMAVEMSRAGNVGKYTGYYYTASMIAQSFTPFISGLLMDFGGGIFNDKAEGMMLLFPYALVFIVLAGVTMFFVRHGDVRPELVSKLEAFDFED